MIPEGMKVLKCLLTSLQLALEHSFVHQMGKPHMGDITNDDGGTNGTSQ